MALSDNDIEAYTPNQLEMAKIKALRRIATAFESVSVSMSRFCESRDTHVTTIGALRKGMINLGITIPDENPDSETDLGLSDEEKREVENEINKEHNPERMPPRYVPGKPVKGRK